VSVWQSLLQPIMAMLSMQSTRNAQVVPLQQPAAPAVLPTAGTKAHCMSSSTQAYADSEGVSLGVWCWREGRCQHTRTSADEAAGVVRGEEVCRGEGGVSAEQAVSDWRWRRLG